jgi:hypothetical protein
MRMSVDIIIRIGGISLVLGENCLINSLVIFRMDIRLLRQTASHFAGFRLGLNCGPITYMSWVFLHL